MNKSFKRMEDIYVVGSNAAKVERMVEREDREEDHRIEPRVDADFNAVNRLCTFVLSFVIIATIAVCIVLLNARFSVGQLDQEIAQKKRELSTLKKVNAQLEDDLVAMEDLDHIYQVATNQLGMRLPRASEVHYIEMKPASYTLKYANDGIEEEPLSIRSIVGFITKGW